MVEGNVVMWSCLVAVGIGVDGEHTPASVHECTFTV